MTKAVFRSVILIATLSAASLSTLAQSTDQLFPTPVRTNEIVSTIKAREIGDSRLTTHYYTFEGDQGDVFINVQSRSFTGDIDVFVMPAQQPLTKMVIYADQPESETGRVIYLRKPERLLLRIQGRTPGDDAASIRIKFAGSFAASKLDESSNPEVPKVGSPTDSDVRVNSVGTILEVVPKAKPTPDAVAERVEETEEQVEKDTTARSDEKQDKPDKKVEADELFEKEAKKVEVVVTDTLVEEPKKPATPRGRRSARSTTPQKSAAAEGEETVEKTPPVRRNTAPRRNRTVAERPKKEEPPKVDPMANIRLVIYFKDGSTIERPMPEVQRFSVERAVLTVIHKNGSIGRYNMTDVVRVSIE